MKLPNGLTKHNIRVTFSSLFVILLTSVYSILTILELTKSKTRIRFNDLNYSLGISQCFIKNNLDIYTSKEIDLSTCDTFIYGRAYLKLLIFFNLNSNYRIVFGLLGIIMLLLIFAIIPPNLSILKNTKYFHLSAWKIIFFSYPGVILLIERGNLDILIYSIVFLACILFSNGKRFLALILIGLTALFKFYTLPVILVWILFLKKRNEIFAYLVSLVFLIFFIFNDIRLISTEIPSGSFITFGISAIEKWTSIYFSKLGLNYSLSWQINLVVVSFFVLFSLLLSIKNGISNQTLFNKEMLFSVTFLTTFISCYLTGMSFDYRLIFLSTAIWYFIQNNPQYLSKRFFKISFVIIFWLGTPLTLNSSRFQVANVITQSFSDIVLYVFLIWLFSKFISDLFAVVKNKTKLN